MGGKILVGYDGSEQARDALCLAEGLAGLTGGTLLLACVEHLGPYELPAASLVDALRERAEQRLAQVVDEVTARGTRAEARPVLLGSAAYGLHELAETERPDLIVVGSSHRGRIGTALTGTVGVRLLHGSPCPVAVASNALAKDGAWRPRTVGVGYDGSPEAALALECAHELAHAAHATVRIVVVAEEWKTPYIEVPIDTKAIRAQTRERAMRWLRDARERLRGDWGILNVSGEVVEAEPTRALAEATEHLDVLVLGSRAYGPVRRVLLGSVASHVLSHSRCSVIVTPRSGGVAAAPDDLSPAAAAS